MLPALSGNRSLQRLVSEYYDTLELSRETRPRPTPASTPPSSRPLLPPPAPSSVPASRSLENGASPISNSSGARDNRERSRSPVAASLDGIGRRSPPAPISNPDAEVIRYARANRESSRSPVAAFVDSRGRRSPPKKISNPDAEDMRFASGNPDPPAPINNPDAEGMRFVSGNPEAYAVGGGKGSSSSSAMRPAISNSYHRLPSGADSAHVRGYPYHGASNRHQQEESRSSPTNVAIYPVAAHYPHPASYSAGFGGAVRRNGETSLAVGESVCRTHGSIETRRGYVATLSGDPRDPRDPRSVMQDPGFDGVAMGQGAVLKGRGDAPWGGRMGAV